MTPLVVSIFRSGIAQPWFIELISISLVAARRQLGRKASELSPTSRVFPGGDVFHIITINFTKAGTLLLVRRELNSRIRDAKSRLRLLARWCVAWISNYPLSSYAIEF